MTTKLTHAEIQKVAGRIGPYIRKTPCIRLPAGSLGCDQVIDLKLEQLQVSGTFKARGAFNAALSNKIPTAGLIAASGGNHGIAVATVAKSLGVPADIFVPSISSPAKQARLKELGANLFVGGANFAEALADCNERTAQSGALFIHAYDQPEVLTGQATLGLEWLKQSPDLAQMVIAVGGGGLAGGVAAAVGDKVKIVAVEPHKSCCFSKANAAGKPTPTTVSGIAADSLGASQIGELPFAVLRQANATSQLVSDDAIKSAQQTLWTELRLAVEPAAAVSLAAVQCGLVPKTKDGVTGILICGANLDLSSGFG